MPRKIIDYFSICVVLFILSACHVLEIYQPKIKQGNILDAHQINKLKIGMNKEMVKEVLGTPVIVDIFHDNNWLYINASSNENYRLTLIFKDDKLQHIDSYNLSGVVGHGISDEALKEKARQEIEEFKKIRQIQKEQFRIRLEELIKNHKKVNGG